MGHHCKGKDCAFCANRKKPWTTEDAIRANKASVAARRKAKRSRGRDPLQRVKDHAREKARRWAKQHPENIFRIRGRELKIEL